MSHRALNPEQFFHGTTAELYPGDRIEPTSVTGEYPTFPNMSDSRYAYATRSESDAWHYAELAWHESGAGIPHVYEVRPAGRHSKDPSRDRQGHSRDNFENDRRSKEGWDYVREVPMPEHMGEPEDWR